MNPILNFSWSDFHNTETSFRDFFYTCFLLLWIIIRSVSCHSVLEDLFHRRPWKFPVLVQRFDPSHPTISLYQMSTSTNFVRFFRPWSWNRFEKKDRNTYFWKKSADQRVISHPWEALRVEYTVWWENICKKSATWRPRVTRGECNSSQIFIYLIVRFPVFCFYKFSKQAVYFIFYDC